MTDTEELRIQYAGYVKQTVDAGGTPLSYTRWLLEVRR